jgi:hypothetical protein
MVSVGLAGGLGNYMFQIAAAYSLAINNNDKLILDEQRSVTVHKGISNYKNNIFRNLEFNQVIYNGLYQEPYFHYKEINYQPNILLSGYFQSEKYFIKNRNEILNLFSIDELSEKLIKEKYNDVNFENSCSLHVRRGDYLKYPGIHPTCDLKYYQNSIDIIDSENILIFSDDLDWCKENLIFENKNLIFIDGNPDYIDMWLMSLCKNNIIANSTFSWWGAWLNNNENKKVFAPKVWFGRNTNHNTEDLIPERWERI